MRELARMPLAARAEAGARRRSTMSNYNRDLVEKLRKVGPEQVVDGFQLCPCCDSLSPGIAMDGETIMHCPICHHSGKVTPKENERFWETVEQQRKARRS
jgi:hypothetical protein